MSRWSLLGAAGIVLVWGAALVRINLAAGAFVSLAISLAVWLAAVALRRLVPSLRDATWSPAITLGLGVTAALNAVATILLLLTLTNRGE